MQAVEGLARRGLELGGIVGEQMAQEGQGIRAFDVHRPHVGDVEHPAARRTAWCSSIWEP
jgi:hypothetical protein